MSFMAKVQQLHELLNAANVRNEEIKGGIRLSDEGYLKLSRKFGTDRAGVDNLLLLLARKIESEEERGIIDEAVAVRFAYEADYLHNVTIRDGKTGQEDYFGGSEAGSILDSLEGLDIGSRQAQEILGTWLHKKGPKSLHEAFFVEGPTQATLAAEIKNDIGSFNFPWKAAGKSGTATAAYTGDRDQFRLKIVDARDQNGDPVQLDDQMHRLLKSQALDFIGDE